MNIKQEIKIDEKLNINTYGRDDYNEDNEHRAYEPTPYDVLDLIINSGFISKNDHVVDMGSGKGRVAFYLAKEIGCNVTGIEYDERIYNIAIKNKIDYEFASKVDFINENAENYDLNPNDSIIFFFNPFSIKLLEKVLSNIVKSYYENKRELKLVFYYPSLEYVGTLMTNDSIEFIDEIDCSHLYKDSKGRECIMIFKVV